MNASAAWSRLEPKLAYFRDRVQSLEYEPNRKNSFVAYTVERDSAYADQDGQRLLMMSGYSYLGLAGDERVVSAAKAAVDRYGTGNHGVRALAGSTPLHEELEAEVAKFAGRQQALVFGSGYAANVGTVGALVGPGDTVFIDKYDHASIVDGCKLSGATVTRFRHNDVTHLERRLAAAPDTGVRLVIVDSVYSMDGDIAPLVDLRKVCDAHNALLMVDEAHALGVIGATGKGIEEHFDYEVKVDVKLGTLSKAIPSMGGWVAGSAELIHHLKYAARPFLFSAALGPAQSAAALESLRILQREPERVEFIQREAERFRTTLHDAGISTVDSETAVVPVIAGSDTAAYDYATVCRKNGVIGLPVVTPAVPNDLARLRIAITAAHTKADLEFAAEAFIKSARECRII
ncbi:MULTISPECIES: aminotransferase class I/II-fold pyridoxal phosphate-dependent enzyme [Streptomyces]|uniref:aminotransferase class I/II-fold pyridoxal phosphate-dependent enzyme n=1 Tax=Streptomyces TaxID=1883 RepID=UPI002271574D|nr:MULTISPECIES: aminotransferase class I/II-fold pyridoxal phosphate-dependent enzyme [unclassified Streptomyces]MCY0947560.1 aminotransferase class I/II-fold pyridoxal phosphate-dependent enzyme [Streptomyces sp. H34-AA3]MCY0955038.1 aminotransferase class I/II-fold pyridoxal phosphate-dependent enzyme [Streptomyces sp. H27-S2]MCZ4087000.1 aminotransferase class I/II-fold pyridoxal phosphate-dependent enzyme [Streptomyces sp. H34-S5]